MTLQLGFKEKDRSKAASLYANAFKRKFVHLIGNEDQVSALLEKGLDPNYCITYYLDDQLVGLAGFHVGKDALVKISLSDFISEFGLFKGIFKGLLSGIIFYRKPVTHSELLMDGIAVDQNFRGQGIGSKLFSALFDWTEKNAYEAIHLDVIDENQRAKALYERLGFETTSYEKIPSFITKLIGVSGVTHMRKAIKEK